MKPNPTALAVSLLSGALLLNAQAASAQTNPPPATATRPAKNPTEQSSVPSNAPPATPTQTTGEANRDPTVKKMNEDEKAKVERANRNRSGGPFSPPLLAARLRRAAIS